jgi:cytochrome oxidase Cu insertion factor (SCO1/SenC/PrrC family)
MSRCIPRYALTLCLAVLPLALAAEASAAERVELGQTAPDFTLPDPDGTEFTASSLRGEKNLLLVFFRGAW